MNRKLACALLLLVLSASACGSITAEPIGGGASSTTSTTGEGAGGSQGSTTSNSTGFNFGGGLTVPIGCAPDCDLGQVCVEGKCHALMTIDEGAVVSNPFQCHIVVDDINVYWQTGAVRRVPKAGGKPTDIAWVGVSGLPMSLAVDDTYLYFTGTNQGILRVEKLKGKFGTSFADSFGNPTRMALGGGMLYFLDDGDVDVHAVPTASPPPANTPPPVFASTFYGAGAIAADASAAYFWDIALVREDRATHERTTLVPQETAAQLGIDENSNLVVDGDTVFYTSSPGLVFGGVVGKVSIGGGDDTLLVANDHGANGAIATDAENVYFMTPNGVYKVDKNGSEPVLLDKFIPPRPFPSCMAADGEAVYWVEGVTLKKYVK